MPLTKPLKRTIRPFVDYKMHDYYIGNPGYSTAGSQYVKAFLLIQKDLLHLFEYIEPASKNLYCFSFRIHELLMRTCIEVEANFTAILKDNIYAKSVKDLNMHDYFLVNKSHHLSKYEIELTNWINKDNTHGAKRFKPFRQWWKINYTPLTWYQAYNSIKHDRNYNFHLASLENLILAVCGLVALISSQFMDYDFSPSAGSHSFGFGGRSDGLSTAIGDFFRIKFPNKWKKSELYDFDKRTLDSNPEFDKHDYDHIF